MHCSHISRSVMTVNRQGEALLSLELYLHIIGGYSAEGRGRRVQAQGLTDDGSSVGEVGQVLIPRPAPPAHPPHQAGAAGPGGASPTGTC